MQEDLSPEQSYILVIDDSKEDAMILQRVIQKSGLPIGLRWIGNAEVALNTLLKDKLEYCLLILLDIKMPLLTGLEILDQLNKARRLDGCPPITVFSSSNEERDIRAVAKFPGVNFQTKPEGYLEIKAWLTPLLNLHKPTEQ